jgi:hypothetical protein
MATLNSRKATASNGLGDDSTGENSVSLSQGRFRSRAVEVEAPSTIRVRTASFVLFIPAEHRS